MTVDLETQAFLDAVERHATKKFRYRTEIATLIELAEARQKRQVFDEIIFYAKFVSNAHAILKRVGVGPEESRKLSAEFKDRLAHTSALMQTLVNEAPQEIKNDFASRFFSLTPGALEKLLALLSELSWIKNYALDKEKGH